MNRIIMVPGIVLTAAVLLSGCMGGAMVQKDGIDGAGRIAVVSVIMPRIADTERENNRAALQAFTEQALARVQSDLRSMRSWKVTDPAGYKGNPAVLSLGAVSDEEIAALLPPGDGRKDAKGMIEQELSQWKKSYIGAKSLPVVPRSALVRDPGDQSPLGLIPQIMQKRAARLCDELHVDAVAFVQVLASITRPRPKTFIVSNNRTDGAIRAAQTMVLVDKTGRVIADMGWPPLDERARTKDLLPLYAGSGEGAVKHENIDLNDPRKKVVQAFSMLIDETSADMIKGFKKAVR